LSRSAGSVVSFSDHSSCQAGGRLPVRLRLSERWRVIAFVVECRLRPRRVFHADVSPSLVARRPPWGAVSSCPRRRWLKNLFSGPPCCITAHI